MKKRDMLKRIEELERRVEELQARPPVVKEIHVQPEYPRPYVGDWPTWPPTTYPGTGMPQITYKTVGTLA